MGILSQSTGSLSLPSSYTRELPLSILGEQYSSLLYATNFSLALSKHLRKMMRLSRLRPHMNALAGDLVVAKAIKDLSYRHEFASSAGFSTASAGITMVDGKVNANHTIFKGKAALTLSPISPKFDQVDISIRVKKPGSVLLTFWPAIGTRKYDWQKRQAISLSPVEIGSLISLAPGESCEFFHDTSKITSISSKALKRLVVQPLSGDEGHMFSLSVTDNILKINDRFSVPVSKGEFAVMRTVCSYILPHIMGWDLMGGQEKQVLASPSNSVGTVKHSKSRDSLGFSSPELEWER